MKFIMLIILFFLSIAVPVNAEAAHWYSYEEGMLAAGAHAIAQKT